MARVRNFLIDNTIGKVFTNVQNVSAANASNIIAGTKLQSKIISSTASTVMRITKMLGNTGIYFPSDSLVTTAVIKLSKAATASGTSIGIKVGTSYTTATLINTTSISANAANTTITLNSTVPAGQYMYIDILSVPSAGAGLGFNITVNFYGT